MKPEWKDVIDENIAALQRWDEKAWEACLPTMTRCAENTVRKVNPKFSFSEVEELGDSSIIRFLKYFSKNPEAYTGSREIRKYLKRIAISQAIDRLQESTGRPRKSAKEANDDQPPLSAEEIKKAVSELTDHFDKAIDPTLWIEENIKDSGPTPSAEVPLNEDKIIAKKALAQTPSPCKEIITQWIYEEAKGRELGEKFGFNEKNASTIISRCLEKMRIICNQIRGSQPSPKGGNL